MLTAIGLTRTFDSRVAVEDISFELAPGEVFALLGPNGAGKTTTLRMLAGLIAPTAGMVSIGGQRLTRETAPRLRKQIGLLTETPGLWERLTVSQNLLTYARLYGLAHPGAAVAGALEQFGLTDCAADLAGQLSKGLKQRVALARALLHEPSVVLLDEPTAGLDPQSARDVRELVLGLRAAGRTVLLSTHNLDEAERIADRVAVLRTRLVAVGTPGALRSRLFGARLRIGLAGLAARYVEVLRQAGIEDVVAEGNTLSIGTTSGRTLAPQIVRQLVEAGAEIESVAPEARTLEEVYLRLLDEEKP